MQNSPVTDALRLAVTQTVRALTQPAGIQAAATELRQQSAQGRPTTPLPLPGTAAHAAASQASASAAVELSPTALLPPVQLANQAAAARGATATPLTVAMLLVPHGLAQAQPGKPAHSAEALKLAARLKQQIEGAQSPTTASGAPAAPNAAGVTHQQATAQYQAMSGLPNELLKSPSSPIGAPQGQPIGQDTAAPLAASDAQRNGQPSTHSAAQTPVSPDAAKVSAHPEASSTPSSKPTPSPDAETTGALRRDPDERLLGLSQRAEGASASSSSSPMGGPQTASNQHASATPNQAILQRADLAYVKTATPEEARARIDVFEFDEDGGSSGVSVGRTLGATLHIELANHGEVVVTLALSNRQVDVAVAGPAAAIAALRQQEANLLGASEAWGVRVKSVSYVPFDAALRLP